MYKLYSQATILFEEKCLELMRRVEALKANLQVSATLARRAAARVAVIASRDTVRGMHDTRIHIYNYCYHHIYIYI